MSQLCWCRAFSHTSCEEEHSGNGVQLWCCCGCPQNEVWVLSLFRLKTPEYCGYPSDQPGLFLLLSRNSQLCLTIIYRTATLVTWVSSKLEPRAFNTLDQLTFSALKIQLSNSPQSFNVVLDTGSSDLWVTDTGCTTCTPGSPTFNSGASSTFQLSRDTTGQPVRVTITYGSGSVAGDLVRDTVSMGGFQVQNQPWLLVDQTSASLLDGSNAGIMGLAFDTIANTGAVPFWQTLAQGGQLTTPEMGFWFTRLLGDTSAQEEEFGGIFTLGGQNQTLFTGDIEFLPLVTSSGRQTYWLLSVSGKRPITFLPSTISHPYFDGRDHC